MNMNIRFLLSKLQLHSVLLGLTIRDRYGALETLPSNLDEASSKSMTRIVQQPPALSMRAAKIIAWVHLSEWHVRSVRDLQYFLAIRTDDKDFDPKGMPVRETIVNCCQGLVLIDKMARFTDVRFINYTRKEHLS